MLIGVLFIVLISISTALILDYIQSMNLNFLSFYVLFGIMLVFGLNVLKVILWGILHKKYDLSSTYPMTAIYFPLIYLVSVYKKEIEIDFFSLFGISLVFIGTYYILSSKKVNH